MSNHYILVPKDKGRGYVPSYSQGFVTAGSLFFHKSGQIWELLGIPKNNTFIKAERAGKVNGCDLRKVGNFSQREKDLSFPDLLILEFGPGSKVTATTRDSKKPPIHLKWRRCSLAEIRLREVIESIE